MAVKEQELPSETGNFGSDLAGIPAFLIDPESAAPRVYSKWFWIGPVLISIIDWRGGSQAQRALHHPRGGRISGARRHDVGRV